MSPDSDFYVRSEDGMLAETLAQYRHMAEFSLDGIVITDLEGRVLIANPAVLQMLEMDIHAASRPVTVFDFIAPESIAEVEHDFAGMNEDRVRIMRTYKARSARGNDRYVEVIGNRITYSGRPANIISVRDVTLRREMEESLRSSEIYLKTIFDLVQTGFVIIDPETHTIVDVNPSGAKMIGIARDQIIGAGCHRFMCPAEQGKCPVTDLAQTVDNSERILLSAGGPRSIIKTVVPVIISGKNFLLESFVDITDRKKAEEALERSEAMYRMLADNSLDIISCHTTDLILNYVSPAARTLMGLDTEWLIGRNLLEFVHPGDHEQVLAASREILDGGTATRLVIRLRTRDGDYRWFESISRAVRDEKTGIITEVYNVSRDITTRKSAEENAHRRDRVLHGFAAASGFLLTGRLKEPIPRVLATIGDALEADVAYIYEDTLVIPEGGHLAVRRHRWARETLDGRTSHSGSSGEGHTFPGEWSHRLASGIWISGCLSRFCGEDRAILEDLGIHSILLVPIFVRETYWGFIGVSDMSTDRVWADSEIEILMTLAATLGLVFEQRSEVAG